MLLQPILKVSEFHGPGLFQLARGEAPDPVVMHVQVGGDLPVLADSLPDSLPGGLNSFLDFVHCGG